MVEGITTINVKASTGERAVYTLMGTRQVPRVTPYPLGTLLVDSQLQIVPPLPTLLQAPSLLRHLVGRPLNLEDTLEIPCTLDIRRLRDALVEMHTSPQPPRTNVRLRPISVQRRRTSEQLLRTREQLLRSMLPLHRCQMRTMIAPELRLQCPPLLAPTEHPARGHLLRSLALWVLMEHLALELLHRTLTVGAQGLRRLYQVHLPHSLSPPLEAVLLPLLARHLVWAAAVYRLTRKTSHF